MKRGRPTPESWLSRLAVYVSAPQLQHRTACCSFHERGEVGDRVLAEGSSREGDETISRLLVGAQESALPSPTYTGRAGRTELDPRTVEPPP